MSLRPSILNSYKTAKNQGLKPCPLLGLPGRKLMIKRDRDRDRKREIERRDRETDRDTKTDRETERRWGEQRIDQADNLLCKVEGNHSKV